MSHIVSAMCWSLARTMTWRSSSFPRKTSCTNSWCFWPTFVVENRSTCNLFCKELQGACHDVSSLQGHFLMAKKGNPGRLATASSRDLIKCVEAGGSLFCTALLSAPKGLLVNTIQVLLV